MSFQMDAYLILGKVLNRLGLRMPDRRERLARWCLKGDGLEIGALHRPLRLPRNARAKYVDRIARQESIRKFPELDASEIVAVDYVDDGFVLSSIPASSQNFVIANHVLEHTPNPIQVLKNWTRILKPRGILFISVPIAEKCFDKGRSLTTLEHFVKDFELYNQNDHAAIMRRNAEHLREWIDVSERNLYTERHPDYQHPSPQEIEKRIASTEIEHIEIHFHTFSMRSYHRLLTFFASTVEPTLRLLKIVPNGGEIIAVMRKHSKNQR